MWTPMSPSPQEFTCDCCLHEVTATTSQIAQDGWIRHVKNGRSILLCGGCETRFQQAWKWRKAMPEEAA